MISNSSNINCNILSKEVNSYFHKLGYSRMKPQGLISNSFPDTFAPSAFHDEILAHLRNGSSSGQEVQRIGVDWVFRHVDVDRVTASPLHLSAFQMAVFFKVITVPCDDTELRQQVVSQFVGVLRSLGLDLQKCLVTYFGGWRFGNHVVPPDEDVIRLWGNCGVDSRQLVSVPGTSCFTNYQRQGESAGPRCEVFLPTANGIMLEVGTVIFERFVIGRKRELINSNHLVYGSAFGIERIAMLINAVEDIIMISDLKSMTEQLQMEIDSRLIAVCQQQARGLIDGIRTLMVIRSQTQSQQLDNRREKRIRIIARQVRRHLTDLGVEDATEPLLERLCQMASRHVCSDDAVVGIVLSDLASAPIFL